MRPIFTVHAGEFVVGEFIERSFPTLDVWIPAKDTGIDFLVTGPSLEKPVSLQVKLSRDYRPFEATDDFERSIVAAGWLTINHEKLANSRADWWVFVLVSHERRMTPRFVIIPPKELLRRLVCIHGKSQRYHFYPWVIENTEKAISICLDGRGLRRADKQRIVDGTMELGERDLSSFLENWSAIKALTGSK